MSSTTFIASPQTADDVNSNRLLLIALKTQVTDAGISDASLLGSFDTLITSTTDMLGTDISAAKNSDGAPELVQDPTTGKTAVAVLGEDGHYQYIEDDPVLLSSIPHQGAVLPPPPPPSSEVVPPDSSAGGAGNDVVAGS